MRHLFPMFALLDYLVADSVWSRDADDRHIVRCGAGGLHSERTKVEKCLYDPILLDGDILHIRKRERCDLSVKKTSLIHRDEPLVGDEPQVEVVVGPDNGKRKPHNEEPPKHDEGEKQGRDHFKYIESSPRSEDKHERRKEYGERCPDRITQEYEPMLAKFEHHMFLRIKLKRGKVFDHTVALNTTSAVNMPDTSATETAAYTASVTTETNGANA